jgi:hypothetical protein
VHEKTSFSVPNDYYESTLDWFRVHRSRFIGVGVGIAIGIDSLGALVSMRAAHMSAAADSEKLARLLEKGKWNSGDEAGSNAAERRTTPFRRSAADGHQTLVRNKLRISG